MGTTIASAKVETVSDIAELLSAARRLSSAVTRAVAEVGLREDLWRLMHELHGSHGLSMGDLAEATGLPPATVTRLIDELAELGAVFRRPSPTDGRKAIVYLAQLGESRLERADAIVEARLLG